MTKYHAILSQHTPDQCQAMLKVCPLAPSTIHITQAHVQGGDVCAFHLCPFSSLPFVRQHLLLRLLDCGQEIEGINPDADLVRFRRQKGTDMPLCVPSFQDYGSKPTIEIVVDQ